MTRRLPRICLYSAALILDNCFFFIDLFFSSCFSSYSLILSRASKSWVVFSSPPSELRLTYSLKFRFSDFFSVFISIKRASTERLGIVILFRQNPLLQRLSALLQGLKQCKRTVILIYPAAKTQVI